MQISKKLSNTIKYLHTIIKPSLELAVADDIIRKNPANVSLSEYGEKPKEKEALTPEQQNNLLAFVEASNTYRPHLPMLQIMFGTCLRVGELISLTWSDIDPKVMQYVMGHSNISVTMDVYNHITEMNRVETEIAKLDTAMAVV